MEIHRNEVIKEIGEDKFDEECKVLQITQERAEAAGQFESIDGDVDKRDDRLKTTKLVSGFKSMCGIKGGKLSGG